MNSRITGGKTEVMQAAFDDQKSKIPGLPLNLCTLKSELDNVKQVNLAILNFRLLHSPMFSLFVTSHGYCDDHNEAFVYKFTIRM